MTADVHTPEQRSRNMAGIRGRDTQPEKIVRRMLHAMGYRFRLHRRDLPGKPDLVFPSRSKTIFVHGCFWHMHECRWGRVTPATNAEFWRMKREETVQRDRRAVEALATAGWASFSVWECEIRKPEELALRITGFLGRAGDSRTLFAGRETEGR